MIADPFAALLLAIGIGMGLVILIMGIATHAMDDT
jgi:hypothetical protein